MVADEIFILITMAFSDDKDEPVHMLSLTRVLRIWKKLNISDKPFDTMMVFLEKMKEVNFDKCQQATT